MRDCTDLADYRWLTGPEAGSVLDDLADRSGRRNARPIHAVADRLRRHFSARRVHLLLEQVELRRRAAAKFAHPERMFFTRLGLEQATDQWVAQYKAGRFAGRGPLADLCCGIGGDLLAIAAQGPTVGIDRDPVAVCFADANVRAGLPNAVADTVSLQNREVEQFAACGFAAWHIDPDRRPAGRRTASADRSTPNRQAIERLLSVAPHAAVKLAPAADVPADWVNRTELEWISRDRDCRQLVAWHGDLTEERGQRRATVLSIDGRVARTLVGQPNCDVPCAQQPDRFLFEPDPAVLAAQLTGTLAAVHRLSAVSSGVAYLTRAEPLDDPALACFAVDEVLPLDLRKLSQHLRARGIGRLEIKKRSVEHDPEQIRRALKLRGGDAATLVLTKLNRKRVAIVARRVERDRFLVPVP